MRDVYKVLLERGFIQQCSNELGLREAFQSGPVTFYIGFDPTGTSLHVGHLLQLMSMAHMQRAGHKPIVLIGGGTARIGDPSGKSEMRKMLTVDDIKANARSFRKQISRFLDFSEGKALMIDNADWLAKLNYIEFLRDIGKHFSVNRMLGFEAYKQRLAKGLSFIEFNYQLLQSYDYLILFRDKGCTLQMGGDDQWGNIIAGIELVRRIEGKEVFALTSPLVSRADGKKMGKTEKGAIYLDPELVSPYEFYQYWVNVPDADVNQFLSLFTFLPLEEIRELAKLKDREINRAKEVLAKELTSIVHGKAAAEEAQQTSRSAFGQVGASDLSAMPTVEIPRNQMVDGLNVIDLFSSSGLCSSKSEARRLVSQGGAYVNSKNIQDPATVIDQEWVRDGIVVLRAGKKRYYKVVVTE